MTLFGRDFLKEIDFTTSELKFLLDLSRDLKRAKYAGTEVQRMRGKNVALIFEKTSTRTRCAFEVGCYDQGARLADMDDARGIGLHQRLGARDGLVRAAADDECHRPRVRFGGIDHQTGLVVQIDHVDRAAVVLEHRHLQLVLEALDMNRITAVQASRYLDLRFDHFDKLRNELRMEPMRPAGSFDDGE